MTEQEDLPSEIRDEEEYTSQRRLKSIFNIRDDIHQTRTKVRLAETSTEDRFSAVCAYRSLAGSYLLEIEPLLRKYESGTELLERREFGTVELRPRVRKRERRHSLDSKEVYYLREDEWLAIADQEDLPEPVVYELKGLQSLFATPNPLDVTFSVEVARGHRHEMVEIPVRDQIGMQALDNMVRTMNNFLSDIGFEVSPEEEDIPAKI